MKKRTPQEIADFFGCYMARDKGGCWYLYDEKPHIDGSGERWNWNLVTSVSPWLIDCSKCVGIDWKDSLCEPRMINDTSGEEDDTLLIKMLSNMIIANMYTYEYTADLKQIADHYGQKELFERLLIECAEMGVVISHSLKSDSTKESLMNGIADLEILLEQVKYLMKIDPVKLGGIKKQNVAIQQSIIAKESHEESADYPRKVRE